MWSREIDCAGWEITNKVANKIAEDTSHDPEKRQIKVKKVHGMQSGTRCQESLGHWFSTRVLGILGIFEADTANTIDGVSGHGLRL
jgi:hypothetical protein